MARLLLSVLLVIGFGLRVFRLGWGLPDYTFPDGVICFVGPAIRFAATGVFVPTQFTHPPLLAYGAAAVYRSWALVTGHTISPVPATASELATFVILGRALCAIIATVSVAALYALTRRLVGTGAALLAAGLFAVAPIHVLESHRVNSDGLAILLGLLAAERAVAADDRHQPIVLMLAFLLAGLAGASKYTGLSALTVPAWMALGWKGASWRYRVALLGAGGFTTGLGFVIGDVSAFTHWKDFLTAMRLLRSLTYGGTQAGLDLNGQGWVYVHYVYGLVVALPYTMGWAAYLTGLAALVFLARTDRRTTGVVLAALIPYFLVQGSSKVIVARYYQPLVPYLALAAGAGLHRLRTVHRRTGVLLACVVLGYTAVLAVSQCRRLGLGPQDAVGTVVAERARAAAAAGKKLVLAYPNPLALFYDAVRPRIRRPGIKEVYFPLFYTDLRAEPAEPPRQDAQLEQDRRWVAETGVDVVILPSWVENAVLRERPDGYAGGFFRRLDDGALGFHRVADFHTTYVTESLYVWGDPMLTTHWETGIVGYKVYVRD